MFFNFKSNYKALIYKQGSKAQGRGFLLKDTAFEVKYHRTICEMENHLSCFVWGGDVQEELRSGDFQL